MAKKADPDIRILNESSAKTLPLEKPEIRRCVRKALSAGGMIPSGCEISLYLVDDDEMRRLNSEYRGIKRTTDVLSFPQFDSVEEIEAGPEGVILLGDVVISLQTMHRRCRRRGEDPSREFSRLLIHGVLHLLGYDHSSRSERRKMHILEDGVIDTLSS